MASARSHKAAAQDERGRDKAKREAAVFALECEHIENATLAVCGGVL